MEVDSGQLPQVEATAKEQTLCNAACFTAAAFFGGIALFPFFVAAAAFCACLDDSAFFVRPFVFPCAIAVLRR